MCSAARRLRSWRVLPIPRQTQRSRRLRTPRPHHDAATRELKRRGARRAGLTRVLPGRKPLVGKPSSALHGKRKRSPPPPRLSLLARSDSADRVRDRFCSSSNALAGVRVRREPRPPGGFVRMPRTPVTVSRAGAWRGARPGSAGTTQPTSSTRHGCREPRRRTQRLAEGNATISAAFCLFVRSRL